MTTAKLTEALHKELGDLLDREWQKVLRPVLLKRIGLYLAEIKAHATEAAQPAAQADMVLVPREPTLKMLDAAESIYTAGYTGTPTADPSDIWRAMLAAAQENPNG